MRRLLPLLLAGCAGSGDLDSDKEEVRRLTALGGQALDAERFDEAVEYYRRAVLLCDKHRELRPAGDRLRMAVDEALESKRVCGEALAAWEAIRQEFRGGKYDRDDFLRRLDKMRLDHRFLRRPWAMPAGAAEIDRLYEEAAARK